jgi:Flp pilus assembly protein TadG
MPDLTPVGEETTSPLGDRSRDRHAHDRQAGDRGVSSIVVALLIVPLVLVVAVVVDGARVLVQRQQTQDAAEAAVTLVASSWRPGSNLSANCSTGSMVTLVAANAGEADSTCQWQASGVGGRFDVTVTRQVDTMFSSLLGRPAPTVTATATAEVGQASAAGGLRPLGLCISHPAVPGSGSTGGGSGGGGGGGRGGGGRTTTTTTTTTSVAPPSGTSSVRISVDGDEGGCGSASGNWSVLDLNGGSQSNNEVQDWIENGYQGVVSGVVPGNTGIPSGSFPIASIVDPSNADPSRVITVPLYRTISGAGANATFEVVSFISLTVTGFKLTGSDRYIEVAFKTEARPVYGAPGIDPSLYRGVNSWRICSLDDTGTCS